MDEALKALVAQGLAALKAGGEIAAGPTDEIQNDAKDLRLKQALDQGNQTAKQWAQRVNRALDEAGRYDRQENPIIQAHYEVSKKIRGEAKDDRSRDLGIIANGQLALHYWIAAFGTLRTYAQTLDMDRVAQDLQTSLDEAKQADEQHDEIARPLLGGQGADQGFMLNAQQSPRIRSCRAESRHASRLRSKRTEWVCKTSHGLAPGALACVMARACAASSPSPPSSCSPPAPPRA